MGRCDGEFKQGTDTDITRAQQFVGIASSFGDDPAKKAKKFPYTVINFTDANIATTNCIEKIKERLQFIYTKKQKYDHHKEADRIYRQICNRELSSEEIRARAKALRDRLSGASMVAGEDHVTRNLKKRRYPCPECNMGKWEDLNDDEQGPDPTCKVCIGKGFKKMNLSQRRQINDKLEAGKRGKTGGIKYGLLRKGSHHNWIMGKNNSNSERRRLMALNNNTLRPSRELERHRLLNRPKSHIVVLEDLLKKIKAAELAAEQR